MALYYCGTESFVVGGQFLWLRLDVVCGRREEVLVVGTGRRMWSSGDTQFLWFRLDEQSRVQMMENFVRSLIYTYNIPSRFVLLIPESCPECRSSTFGQIRGPRVCTTNLLKGGAAGFVIFPLLVE